MSLPLAFPDQEQVLLDLLSTLGPAVTWLPPKYSRIIWVQRVGGGPDPWDITDYGLIRVSTFDEKRNDSMALSAECERLIMSYRQGGVIVRPGKKSDGMLLDSAGIDTGPSVDPDLDPDERRVTKNFVLGMRRQYHLAGV